MQTQKVWSHFIGFRPKSSTSFIPTIKINFYFRNIIHSIDGLCNCSIRPQIIKFFSPWCVIDNFYVTFITWKTPSHCSYLKKGQLQSFPFLSIFFFYFRHIQKKNRPQKTYYKIFIYYKILFRHLFFLQILLFLLHSLVKNLQCHQDYLFQFVAVFIEMKIQKYFLL